MEDNSKNLLKFIQHVNDLKHAVRKGWEYCNIKNAESISGHMYSMGMMTFLLLGQDDKLDRLKCMQLAMVHDLAECIVGDITPKDNVSDGEKHRLEDEAMKTLSNLVGKDVGNLLYNLWLEYEEKKTPESLFVKDLDRFDMIFTAYNYERRDNEPKKLQEFFDSTDGKFRHPLIKNLVEKMLEEREKQHSD